MHRIRSLVVLTLAVAAPAWAVDLDDTVSAWSETLGLGGNEEAHGVAIDADGSVVVAGVIDGALGEEQSGYALKLRPAGTVVWDWFLEAGPVNGIDKVVSTDRLHAVDITAAGEVILAGTLSGPVGPWDTAWWVGRIDGAQPAVTPIWEQVFVDGASPDQSVLGLHADGGSVLAAGWSLGDGAAAGQWVGFELAAGTGDVLAGPVAETWGTEAFAPEQAQAVAVDSQGNVVVVGTRGVDGANNSYDADQDWHIVKYAPGFASVLWEHTWTGPAGLMDVPSGVGVTQADTIVVAGSTNVGTDNGAGADWRWVVLLLPADGPLDPLGPVLWEERWTSTPGASERALALAVGPDDTVHVGGEERVGTVTAARVAQLDLATGEILASWTGPAATGDSAITTLDVDATRLAMAGHQGNATDRDMFLAFREVDGDGDGVTDSADLCPADPTKSDPGVCGCGSPDIDSDYDGALDCVDLCPTDPDKALDAGQCGCLAPEDDSDEDGTPDCLDNCPEDPNKTELGECGCGAPDDDTDGDGVLGCNDACSNTPPGTPVDNKGCPLEDPTPTDPGSTPPGDGASDADPPGETGGDDGCGCVTAGPPAAWVGILAGLLALGRRRP